MDINLFNQIAQTLKDKFPEVDQAVLMDKASEMYEAEMRRRSMLSDSEKFRERLRGKMSR